ncbi:MAG: hypothetical protein K6F57_04025 [Candidatus Saccharibacteria bacterium]|nr:hypothetical protein [Candidatus Saccharibacteria bacterium]
MGKHTLRNLGEQPKIVKKKPAPKTFFFKKHSLILFAIAIIFLSAVVANTILFAEEYFYINSCTLGYETDCATATTSTITIVYDALILLPVAFTIFAIIRAFQKSQKVTASIAIAITILTVFAPFLVSVIYNTAVNSYSKTTTLAIQTPTGRCELHGLTPSSDTCRISGGPGNIGKQYNSATIPVAINDNIVAVRLDPKLNILNIDHQNIHVCPYFNNDPNIKCYELRYSESQPSVYEDNQYIYSYQKNTLTISEKQ